MIFRDRLLGSLRAMQPVLAVDGVLVIGSEVPNLLQEGAASTLVVSQDVDIGIPIGRHAEVKAALGRVQGLKPSVEEPSVWLPSGKDLLEVNFVGMDSSIFDAADTYVLEDEELPLLVFGQLGLLEPGSTIEVDGVPIPVPRPAGLILEKLLSDRTGVKGARDLLVVLGLLLETNEDDIGELLAKYRGLPAELRQYVRSNLTVLSLLSPQDAMPDPEVHRELIASLLHRIEKQDVEDED